MLYDIQGKVGAIVLFYIVAGEEFRALTSLRSSKDLVKWWKMMEGRNLRENLSWLHRSYCNEVVKKRLYDKYKEERLVPIFWDPGDSGESSRERWTVTLNARSFDGNRSAEWGKGTHNNRPEIVRLSKAFATAHLHWGRKRKISGCSVMKCWVLFYLFHYFITHVGKYDRADDRPKLAMLAAKVGYRYWTDDRSRLGW